MVKKSKTTERTRSRVNVKDLKGSKTKLSAKDMKKVRGGAFDAYRVKGESKDKSAGSALADTSVKIVIDY